MASRKNVKFDADELEEELDDDKNTRFKEKHSLDSDEEDDNKKYDVLADDDIEGQEEATIDFDENIQITPFNMREEMEEGHFDTDGTYIFDKTKEIHDSWIDNIDWVKVKHKEGDESSKTKRPFEYSDNSDEESDDGNAKSNVEVYEEILALLREGETISAAIRRLGKSKAKIPSASQKWKTKKLRTATGNSMESNEAEIEQAKEDQKNMIHLMELTDSLVNQGIMEIYETPYQRLSYTIKQLKEKEKASRLTIAEGMKDDDALDMFADDFDAKDTEKRKSTEHDTKSEGAFKVPGQPTEPKPSTVTTTDTTTASPTSATIMWEYKETDTADSDVKGPYTSSQMMTWTKDGTFGKGVLCRKIGSDGQFYSSARIDFDLYD